MNTNKDATGLLGGVADPEEDRTKHLTVRPTREEYTLIRDLAAEMGLSQNDLLLRLLEPAFLVLNHVRGKRR